MSIVGIVIKSNEVVSPPPARPTPAEALDEEEGETPPTPPEALPDADKKNPKQQITNVVAAYVKWIPTEVVVGYGAFVVANWANQQEKSASDPQLRPTPDYALWWVALVFCPILVLAAAWLGNEWPKLVRKAVLATVGFVVWSISVPHSIWSKWESAVENGLAIGLVLVLGEDSSQESARKCSAMEPRTVGSRFSRERVDLAEAHAWLSRRGGSHHAKVDSLRRGPPRCEVTASEGGRASGCRTGYGRFSPAVARPRERTGPVSLAGSCSYGDPSSSERGWQVSLAATAPLDVALCDGRDADRTGEHHQSCARSRLAALSACRHHGAHLHRARRPD